MYTTSLISIGLKPLPGWFDGLLALRCCCALVLGSSSEVIGINLERTEHPISYPADRELSRLTHSCDGIEYDASPLLIV